MSRECSFSCESLSKQYFSLHLWNWIYDSMRVRIHRDVHSKWTNSYSIHQIGKTQNHSFCVAKDTQTHTQTYSQTSSGIQSNVVFHTLPLHSTQHWSHTSTSIGSHIIESIPFHHHRILVPLEVKIILSWSSDVGVARNTATPQQHQTPSRPWLTLTQQMIRFVFRYWIQTSDKNQFKLPTAVSTTAKTKMTLTTVQSSYDLRHFSSLFCEDVTLFFILRSK